MAVYTALSEGEIAALIEPLCLGALCSVRGIPSGIENTNYFVDTTAGNYVLTVFERLTAEQLPFYLHLMKHLAARGIPVPDPAADAGGQILHAVKGKPAVIVNRLVGQSISPPSPMQCRALGVMLARMHRAGGDYRYYQPNPRGLGWWQTMAPVVRSFLTVEQQALLADELAFQVQLVASSAFAQLPCGPVHGDLFRDNALFAGDELTGVFDFYFAGFDVLLFDIAVCLNDWCVEGDDEYDLRIKALLGGYEAVRPLSETEHKLLPAMRRAGALRFWLSRLADLHLPRVAAMLNAHDPAHFERLLRNLREEGLMHAYLHQSTPEVRRA